MKIKLGQHPYLYPLPTVILGTTVNGSPNFATVAFCGIVQQYPPMVSVTMIKNHYTYSGLKQHNSFSINIPNSKMVKVVDFIGMNSGERIDKSKLFEVFYGELENAPMVKQTPLNMECRIVRAIELSATSRIFIAEIVQTYCEKKYLRRGKPYIKKLDPIIFSINTNKYFRVGSFLGNAWSIGLSYKKNVVKRDFSPT